MTLPADISRRRLLSLFGGAPLLPLASSMTAAGLLTACGGDGGDEDTVATFKSAAVIGFAAPGLAAPAEIAVTTVKSTLKITYSDDSTRDFALGYETFCNTGDSVASSWYRVPSRRRFTKRPRQEWPASSRFHMSR